MKKYQITGFYWQKLRLTRRVIQDFARFSSNSFKEKTKPEYPKLRKSLKSFFNFMQNPQHDK